MSPNLFDYLDYRQFLKDHTSALKQAKMFNLRSFAKQAGIQAPGYLKMIIDGRRNLTNQTAEKFAMALGLTAKLKDYFLTLVVYNQTEDPDEKKQRFDKLIALKPRSEHFLAEKRHSRYFSRHHYVCIREMVALKDFKEDYKEMAHRCVPKISPAEAKEAVETLLELGLLKRDGEGRLVQIENFIHTQDKNTQDAASYHFHESVIDKARHALVMVPQNERNFYALTVPLPKEMFSEIVSEFYEFRDKVIEKLNAHGKTYDEVYQINFQLFPVTKKETRHEN